jgi:hypothetical protein
MKNTYKEIKRITGNNKGYAEAAHAKLLETCPWEAENPTSVIYLRSRDNDWVAIPDAYADELMCGEIANIGAFTTVRGIEVLLGADNDANYIAVAE